jgi:flagellar biosynthetic protein FlhB
MAEGSSGQDRTESPTPKKREEARTQGRIARSQDLSTAVLLLAGTVLLAGVGGRELGTFAVRLLRESARTLVSDPLTSLGAIQILRDTTQGLIVAMLPFGLGLAGIVVGANLAQARGVISLKPITPSLTNINLLGGIKRIVSLDSIVTLLKSSVKIALLAFITWQVVRSNLPELVSLAGASPVEVGLVARGLTVKLALTVGLAFLVIAGADYWYQCLQYEKSLRMTKQDVISEHKDSDGNPMIKGRIRSLARSRARQLMLQDVHTADVVVVNPTHVAVALRYDIDVAPAPIVVAMGERKLAERIKALAFEASVPVIENRAVARALLATATVGQMVPSALYTVVAEVLAFVYRQRVARSGAQPAAPERRTP